MPKTSRPPSPLRAVFGARLRTERKARGYTLEEVAHRAHLDWSYLAQLERGKRNVGIDALDALAQAIGIPLHQLLDPRDAPVLEPVDRGRSQSAE